MPLDDVVDVCRAILVELYMVAWTLLEDDNGDVDRAEHAELVSLFEEPILAL
jgi:hypothetical protein